MFRVLLSALVAAVAAAPSLFAQQRIEVVLERRENARWKAADPGRVFQDGDQIRFRFKSSFAGHLFVVNQGTSGSQTTLFPSPDTGTDNQVEAGREYLIPAGQGAFRITGPAGYDTVYWVVSPVPLNRDEREYKPMPAPPEPGVMPLNLTPRCDDAVFRARGECVDSGAGVRKPTTTGGAARELFFIRKNEKSVVAAPRAASEGPVIYEFRIAHR